MKKSLLGIATGLIVLPSLSYADSPYFSFKDGDGFKRFSVSMGALYVKPTGKAQPVHVNTSVAEGESSTVGDVSINTVKDSLSPDMDPNLSTFFIDFLDALGAETLPGSLSGDANIYGLSQWDNPGTGLEADDVTTLGIMTNYFFTDNISLEIKAGIPPKVDLQGKGQIYAPLSAEAHPSIDLPIIGDVNLPSIDLEKNIFITDLSSHGAAASARAWTPAFEFQYHFGKTGINKFRPYVGLGMMYAYFNEVKLNSAIENDLIDAGHMIINIKEGKAGAALDRIKSSGDPKVKVDTSDAFAPIATLGFTYDFNDRWFAVGSVSYAHLTGEATITVNDSTYGELIRAKNDIEINPILGYAGVGYRF